ncbi:helix-turn-helix domain-containing protein [Roseateles sp. LYH14W]|uniref:Helix-turn-helix domain-containing protein n=1 Tax=Pelomonas parva TaxID=3299032 RepID=A0ABW7F8Z2_9BURK
MVTRGKNGGEARGRLARRLRELRDVQKFSQEELGARAELHRTYVGSVERRERNVSIDNIERLAPALGVDICELLAAG